MITNAIRSATSEDEVLFVLTSYVEAARLSGRFHFLSERVTALPLEDAGDVSARLSTLLFELDLASRSFDDYTRDVLHEVVAAPELAGAALLVVANKQDVPGASPVIELIRELRLDTLPRERRWHIQGACARTGDGLFDGLDWVASLWTASS